MRPERYFNLESSAFQMAEQSLVCSDLQVIVFKDNLDELLSESLNYPPRKGRKHFNVPKLPFSQHCLQQFGSSISSEHLIGYFATAGESSTADQHFNRDFYYDIDATYSNILCDEAGLIKRGSHEGHVIFEILAAQETFIQKFQHSYLMSHRPKWMTGDRELDMLSFYTNEIKPHIDIGIYHPLIDSLRRILAPSVRHFSIPPASEELIGKNGQLRIQGFDLALKGVTTIACLREKTGHDFSIELVSPVSSYKGSSAEMRTAYNSIVDTMRVRPNLVALTEKGLQMSWMASRQVPYRLFKNRVDELKRIVNLPPAYKIIGLSAVRKLRIIPSEDAILDPWTLECTKLLDLTPSDIKTLFPTFNAKWKGRPILDERDIQFAEELTQYLAGCSLPFNRETLKLFIENLLAVIASHQCMDAQRRGLWASKYPGYLKYRARNLIPIPARFLKKWLHSRYPAAMKILKTLNILVPKTRFIPRCSGNMLSGLCRFYEFNRNIDLKGISPPSEDLVERLHIHMKSNALSISATAQQLKIHRNSLSKILAGERTRVTARIKSKIQRLIGGRICGHPVAKKAKDFTIDSIHDNVILLPEGQASRFARTGGLPGRPWLAKYDFEFSDPLTRYGWPGPPEDFAYTLVDESISDTRKTEVHLLNLSNKYHYLRYYLDKHSIPGHIRGELENLVPLVSLDTILDRMDDYLAGIFPDSSLKRKCYDLVHALSHERNPDDLMGILIEYNKYFGESITREIILNFLLHSSKLWLGQKTGLTLRYSRLADEFVSSLRIPGVLFKAASDLINNKLESREQLLFFIRNLANARRYMDTYSDSKSVQAASGGRSNVD